MQTKILVPVIVFGFAVAAAVDSSCALQPAERMSIDRQVKLFSWASYDAL
jgi:hypothetical protein